MNYKECIDMANDGNIIDDFIEANNRAAQRDDIIALVKRGQPITEQEDIDFLESIGETPEMLEELYG